jgi:3-dehydroquinate synthase
MFGHLRETTGSKLDGIMPSSLHQLIRRNVEIKACIVEKDERDRTGERALLNFGHTVAHGIERAGKYETFLHGEAVSLGIVAACAVSAKRAGLAHDQRHAIVDLLNNFGLPTKLPPHFPRQEILDALKFDKKFEHQQVRFVLTPKIGSAFLSSDVSMEDIREAVEGL